MSIFYRIEQHLRLYQLEKAKIKKNKLETKHAITKHPLCDMNNITCKAYP